MSKNTIKLGWKCPECGTVYAPHVNECTRYHGPTNKYVWPPYYVWPYQWVPYHPNPWITYTDTTDAFEILTNNQASISIGWNNSDTTDIVRYTVSNSILEGR